MMSSFSLSFLETLCVFTAYLKLLLYIIEGMFISTNCAVGEAAETLNRKKHRKGTTYQGHLVNIYHLSTKKETVMCNLDICTLFL